MLFHEKNVTKTIAILIFSLGFLLEAGRLKIYLRPRPGPSPQVVDLSMGDSSGEPGEAAGALHHRDSQGGTSPQAGAGSPKRAFCDCFLSFTIIVTITSRR